jgi:hypothetical protein
MKGGGLLGFLDWRALAACAATDSLCPRRPLWNQASSPLPSDTSGRKAKPDQSLTTVSFGSASEPIQILVTSTN